MEIIKCSDNQIMEIHSNYSNNKIDFPNLFENKIDYNENKKFTKKNIFFFFISEVGFSFIIVLVINIPIIIIL